jgi:hypothetical protein
VIVKIVSRTTLGHFELAGQPRRFMRLHDMTRTAWQGIGTMSARTDILKQLRKGLAHFLRGKTP